MEGTAATRSNRSDRLEHGAEPLPELPVPLRPAAVPCAVFVAPSSEHRFLLRRAGWLVAPPDGRGGLLSRALREAMVAPMTQLTFASFDLQCYLYQVFHTTLTARLGHLLGMTAEVLCLLAALANVPLGTSGLHAGHVLAATLSLWHAAVALGARLPVWAAVAAVLPWALLSLGVSVATPLAGAISGDAAAGTVLLWLAAASAMMVALSHLPEPTIPPRTVEGSRWRSVLDYLRGRGEPPLASRTLALRLLRLAVFFPLGMLNEAWAGLRLMPYGWLFVMFRAGYAPARWSVLKRREQAGRASGNPALDYVGIGGDTMLEPD